MTGVLSMVRRRAPVAATLSMLTSRAGSGIASLVATPIVFSRLGPHAFGIWTVLLGGAALATYADAGLGSTLLREASRAHTSSEALRRARTALGLAFVWPTVLGAGLAGVTWAGWPWLASALRLEGLSGPARAAVLILIGGIVLDGWGLAGRAPLEGTGRIPRAAAVTALGAVISALLSVVAVLSGGGLVGLALAQLAGATIRAVLLIALSRVCEPNLRPQLHALSAPDFRALVRYGAAVQASQASGAVNAESDRLVVSGVAGATSAGGLDLGLRLTGLLGLVPFCMLYSIFPSLARLAADGETERLDELYSSSLRIVAVTSLVPAAVFAGCAPSLVALWIGHPVPFAAECLRVLAPASGVVALTGAASAVCRAEGRPGRETRFATATAALNVLLTIALASTVGRVGVPAATAAAAILGSVTFLVVFHRVTKRPVAMLARALAPAAFAAVAAGAATVLAGSIGPPAVDRTQAAAVIGRCGLAGVLAAAAVLAGFALRIRPRAASAASPGPAEGEWVVYLSGIVWEGPRNRQHELALQLAQGRRVLFVEAPGLLPAWRLRISPLGESLWRVAPLALLPCGRHLPAGNRLNRRYSALRLRRWLDRRGGERIVVVDEDLAAPMAARLGAHLCVYDAADLDWTFTRRWNRRHLQAALAEAVDRADLVLTSSSVLARHLPPARGRVVQLLNACDPAHFDGEAPISAALTHLPKPRIGYVGAVDDRAFDSRLVAAVAGRHPEWTFVLAGPASRRAAAELSQLSNVRLLGAVNYEEVPRLLRGFDVCLIPYRVGERIDYVQPKKLFEYLAAGKPVVATALPALRSLEVPCHVVEAIDKFDAAIAAALAECDEVAVEQRRRCARSHSWNARGQALRELLDEAMAVA